MHINIYYNDRKKTVLPYLNKVTETKYYMLIRPMCNKCNKNYCAVNCIKNGKTYYRKICDACGRVMAKLPARKPNWSTNGYKKKPTCDVCGFHSILPTQITVFHIDGNLENISLDNLRSVCLNCVEVIKKREVNWKRGDLQVDN